MPILRHCWRLEVRLFYEVSAPFSGRDSTLKIMKIIIHTHVNMHCVMCVKLLLRNDVKVHTCSVSITDKFRYF